jgi:hypothetical protein
MRLQGPNVAISPGPCQPPTADQLVSPSGNMAGQFFPSVFIRVHSRFPTPGHHPPASPPPQIGPNGRQATNEIRSEGTLSEIVVTEDTLCAIPECDPDRNWPPSGPSRRGHDWPATDPTSQRPSGGRARQILSKGTFRGRKIHPLASETPLCARPSKVSVKSEDTLRVPLEK